MAYLISTLDDVPNLLKKRLDYESLIPPLSGSDQPIPTVTAKIVMELLTSGYQLRVDMSTPVGYSSYYEGLHPEFCFIYTIPAGEEEAEFLRVMQVGEMETLPITAAEAAGDVYRKSTYVKVFEDIQELRIARDIIITNIYALYTNMATIDKSTAALRDELLVVPTDITSKLDETVVKLLNSKASYLQTQAVKIAYEAELEALGHIQLRVKSAEDQLKLVDVALHEIGTPDQLAQSQVFFKTFGEILDRLDLATAANEKMTPVIEAASNEAGNALSSVVETVEKVKTDLSIPGSNLKNLAVTSGYAHSADVASYVDSVVTAFNTIINAITPSQEKLTIINALQLPALRSASLVPSATSMKGQYESDKVVAARGIRGVQTMLSQVVPMIKVLADIMQTTASSSRRVQATVETALVKIGQLNTDAESFKNAIANYTTQIQQYVPSFNPDQPFYRWTVNIDVKYESAAYEEEIYE